MAPIGGGGLILHQGVALAAAKETNPRLKVIGVQPAATINEGGNCRGPLHTYSPAATMAMPMAVAGLGKRLFPPDPKKYVDDIVTVDEEGNC